MVVVVDKVFDLLLEDLYALIKDVVIKNMKFKDILQGVESKLDDLKRVLPQMVKSNDELDRSRKELEGLTLVFKSGIELISKCSKPRWWGAYQKFKYADKLTEWDKTLESELGKLPLYIARDVKVISTDLKEVGRDTKEIANKIQKLETSVENLANQVMGKVQSQPPEPRALMSTIGTVLVPELPRNIVALDTHLEKLKKSFLRDGGSMIVLTASGGCGKTTLASMLYHDHKVREKFNQNIFLVTVKAIKSNEVVVHELCVQMGFQEPAFPNEDSALNRLQQILKETGKTPFLFILDDVWPSRKSESLLEKFNDVPIESNCNVLVTSRSSFPSFGSAYPLGTLDDKDALTLFRLLAIRGDQSYYIPENIQKNIVKRCKGCPLAIKVVAKSLCGKHTESWQTKLSQWSMGASFFETETEVLLCLKNSLDALGENDKKLKECFLDLSAFPEDQRIPVTALIDIWTELYDLKGDFASVACLNELSNRSLANLVVTRKEKMEADGYYTEHYVSHHDMLRDLALFEAKLDPKKTRLIIDKCGGKVPKNLTEVAEQNLQSIQPRILSISLDGVLSTSLDNIQLPKVEVLVLNFEAEYYNLPKFVAEMKNLKVLIVTNHGPLPAELNNFQLLESLPELKRIRLERISIPSIAKNRAQLKSLMKMSLFMCSIGQAFSDSSLQISEAFPRLEELNIDYCRDLVELPVDICNLFLLRKLSITHCHKLSALPDDIGQLINLELLRLKSCIDLVTFPATTRNLKKLEVLDISDCFSIKELPKDIDELSSLKNINMRQCSRVKELPESVAELEKLEEVICDEETKEFWEISGLEINIRVLKEEYNLIDALFH